MIVKKREKMADTNLKEFKSQLAKLMANENIQIEHQKISTAKFDVKNRVLYLPIWTDMTGYTYDLLCGHEVGHALFTPEEGWHDAVVDKAKGKNYKNFLNVVEDARIEKRVQRKYPGLKQSFKKAYADLMKKDFFGIGKRDINSFPFIDRLNLFTKSQYVLPVDFNEYETKLLEKVKAAESWDDVVAVTKEIYDYSKDEQLDYGDELSVDIDLGADEELEDGDEFDSKDNENTIEPEAEDKKEVEDDNQASSGNNDDGEEDNGEDKQQVINRVKEDNASEFDQELTPSCQTDENYRDNEGRLVDEQCKPYRYLEFPKVKNYKDVITPVKRVQELLTKDFEKQISDGWFPRENIDKFYNEFKKKNDKYISLLAKEFEMKKAAKVFAKRKVSSTGELDINKLASYKFDDNIFRKAMIVPKGKSHGLILLLDYSGSMYSNLAGSIEQILVLAGFCRKVNIPFTVMSFSNDRTVWQYDRDIEEDIKPEIFEKKTNTIAWDIVQLREYINSDMNNVDYTKAAKNMVLLMKAWEHRSDWRNSFENYRTYPNVPKNEKLTNTPLSQAIYCLGDYTKGFKKSKNLDLVNLVIVHDGDADGVRYYQYYGLDPFSSSNEERWYPKQWLQSEENIIVKDNRIQFQSKLGNKDDSYNFIFNTTVAWYKKYTGSKVIGFYIVDGSSSRDVKSAVDREYLDHTEGYRYDWNGIKEAVKKFRKDKMLVANKKGFNDFYLILGGKSLKVKDPEIEVNGKVTASKLKTAFMKVNKSKQVNRVLVSKFIEKIAA